ncbi:HAMP domain-containing protein [Candidatus Accumulibacter phosphatis]|uniref:histidine kinase n=1 Tax=Candidatus Accumulibacter phosphatis TaxID=327160 RepID=A0ABX1U0J7_9PROT|nr:ATP-binding protein [Candidatus Accumulibacter sp. ACC012]NMQ29278.1 HAMP domain-containing protein [Candidatus Accumulibacter phosphatis]
MGRLFWKSFFAFWLALLLAGVGVGSVVWLHRQAEAEAEAEFAAVPALPGGPRAAGMLDAAEVFLRRGDPQMMREVLREWAEAPGKAQLFVVDEGGRDLFGRELPDELRAALASGEFRRGPLSGARRVLARDGQTYTLLARHERPGGRARMAHRERPSAALPIFAGLLASLAFSAALAWYVAKPIRSLRGAFRAVSEGHLETRVQPSMGKRRDELADLGRDFDRMAQRLQAQIHSQRRLLHDVSHELRSPLARLHAAIGLARQSPEKLEMTLERIERESLRLDELVGELLTLSRLEAGTPGAPPETIDLMEMVASIADDAGFEAEASGRRVHFSGAGEVTAAVQGELLYRAVENVVRNAAKYTVAGSTVEVQARRLLEGEELATLGTSGASGVFEIVVSDRGPGVPEADLEAIFEPFYRADNNAGTIGYGLGLAIAQRALLAHGGQVRARNRSDGGLEVTLSLPLA